MPISSLSSSIILLPAPCHPLLHQIKLCQLSEIVPSFQIERKKKYPEFLKPVFSHSYIHILQISCKFYIVTQNFTVFIFSLHFHHSQHPQVVHTVLYSIATTPSIPLVSYSLHISIYACILNGPGPFLCTFCPLNTLLACTVTDFCEMSQIISSFFFPFCFLQSISLAWIAMELIILNGGETCCAIPGVLMFLFSSYNCYQS